MNRLVWLNALYYIRQVEKIMYVLWLHLSSDCSNRSLYTAFSSSASSMKWVKLVYSYYRNLENMQRRPKIGLILRFTGASKVGSCIGGS